MKNSDLLKHVNVKDLPVDKVWTESISQLRCPQCFVYRAHDVLSLERHVILMCGSRSALVIQAVTQLVPVIEQSEDDPLDVVKLGMEAKLLKWREEGLPVIPAAMQKQTTQDRLPALLTLWRLWLQEIDEINRGFPVVDLLRLSVESEQITNSLESKNNNSLLAYSATDYNYELMAEVTEQLTTLHSTACKSELEKDVDLSAISRLEKEALYLFGNDH